jgi:opacity protein-like surface antigen
MKPLFSLVLVLICSSGFAADFSRAGTIEFGGVFKGFAGKTVDASIERRSGDLELDSIFGGGINLGYHFSDHLNVNTDFVFSRADVSFSGSGLDLEDDADFLAWMVNLDYYILPTRFTPFVTGGLGLLSLNNENDDDWFVFYPQRREISLSEVNLLWNAGAGVRWDPIEHLYIKLAYRLNGTELEYSDEHTLLHSVILAIGYSFQPR